MKGKRKEWKKMVFTITKFKKIIDGSNNCN
jgi:hypothetical protein